MPTEITTPPGRIVWGHPTKARPRTDQKTKQVLLDQQGNPRQSWSFGVAFDKATFQQHIWPALAAEAATAFPQGAPPAFAWKYVDGDGVDREGKPFNQREGYAGCYVLSISTELQAPPIFKFANGAYQQLAADGIKCGDYVAVGLNLKANVPTDRTQTPGIYINPTAVEFVGYGTEIVSAGTADPNAIFKGQHHALPPGASATPIGAPAGAPGMPGTGQAPAYAPPGGPPPGYPPQQPQYAPPAAQPGGYPAPQAAPGGYPPPAYDFAAGQPGQPMQQPQYAPPPMQQPGYLPQQPMQPQYTPQPGPGAPAGYPQPGMIPPGR